MSPTPAGGNRPLRGMLLLLCALVLFAGLDAIAKYLARSYSIPLLVWARYVVHALGMVLILAPSQGRRLLATHHPLRQVVRGGVLVACSCFGFASLAHLPLAEACAIAFTAPLIVALLAGPWLGERLSAARWLAVGLGFAGVLLIARPGGQASLTGLVLALSAATFYAIYQILTRQLARTETPLSLAFYTALTGSLGMSLGLPWFVGELAQVQGQDVPWIVALGVLGGSGHYLVGRAFRHAPASTLSPLIYVQLIWATLIGILIFGEWPALPSWLGMASIAACGLWLAFSARRESRT